MWPENYYSLTERVVARTVIVVGLLLGLLWANHALGQAAPTQAIVIQNPSFEQLSGTPPTMDQCGLWGWQGQGGFQIQGWQFGANSGVFQPANPNPCGIPLPPDGSTVAYAGYGAGCGGGDIATTLPPGCGQFSQDLGVKPSDLQAVSRDGLYVLRFTVANRFGTYPGYYEARLLLGPVDSYGRLVMAHTQELCSTDGWATQNFREVSFVCPVPGYFVYDNIFSAGGTAIPADPNAHLVPSFYAAGWTVFFDKVSLTFKPE
jgi:hypothetical protein